MAIPVLLVATVTRWFAAARMPRALAKTGFEASLLTPPGSLAEHSAFLAKVGHLPDAVDPMQWVFAFAAIVKATSPRLVIPCDASALRFLHMLALAPPEGMKPELQSQLASLIHDSLGDPAHYRTSRDKTLLPPAADALGLPIPPYAIAETPGEAQAFASRNGFPVVLKRDDSTEGKGVAICADSTQLARSFDELKRAAPQSFEGSGGDRLLVQSYVAGPTTAYTAVAWKGSVLVGYASTRLSAGEDSAELPAVRRYYSSAELRAITTKLAAGFGITGFFAPEFVEDAGTGRSYLLGTNRHLVAGAHAGSRINVDHWAALHAALEGLPSPARGDLDAGEEHVVADFPREWLRDPQSRWLREYPVDLPWDEPKLIEAMLALRRER